VESQACLTSYGKHASASVSDETFHSPNELGVYDTTIVAQRSHTRTALHPRIPAMDALASLISLRCSAMQLMSVHVFHGCVPQPSPEPRRLYLRSTFINVR